MTPVATGPAREWLTPHGPLAAMPAHRIIDKGRARIVIATAGAEGGYALVRGEDEVRTFDATPPVAPVVDSNGAGDAFVSGFLFGLLAGEPVDTCLRYGAIAGVHACTVPSTAAAIRDHA